MNLLHDAPVETHGGQFFLGRGALGHHLGFQIVQPHHVRIPLHGHEPAGRGTDDGFAARLHPGFRVHADDAAIFLLLENGAGFRIILRSDDDIRENGAQHTGQAFRHRAVDHDHSAEGGLRIRFKSLLPCVAQVFVVLAHAAGIRVLQNAHRRAAELGNQLGCPFNVQHVRIGKLLALKLVENIPEAAVQAGFLVGIVPVTQFLIQGSADAEAALGAFRALVAKIISDGVIVIGGAHKHLHRQVFTGLQGRIPLVGLHFIQNARVIREIRNHRDGSVILGGGTEHGRPADIYFFNSFLQRDSGPGDGFFKRIQIHADQVDGLDAIFLSLAHMLLIVAAVQQAPVHHGMKRLQAPFKQLRFSGIVGNLNHRKAQAFQESGGPASGNKLYSKLVQALGKLLQAGLVGNGYQCALNSHKIKYL